MDLEFEITNQTVTRKEKRKVVNYSDDYLRLCFSFSDDWSDCSKFLLVFDEGEVYRFGLTSDKFIVPEELLTGSNLTIIFGVVTR